MCRDPIFQGFSIHHYGRHRSGMAATDRPSSPNGSAAAMLDLFFVYGFPLLPPCSGTETCPPTPPAAALAWLLGEVDAHFLRILEGL
jgi:hypothetical protein